MTISPEMRDLAQRLLTYEAAADKSSGPMDSPTLRAYEKLRQCLVSLAGLATFQSIAARALVLTQEEVPGLCAVRVSAEGALEGLGDIALQMGLEKSQTGGQREGEDPLHRAGTILIARILCLLLTFLGEALTLSLLRSAWPDATLDDRNSGNGRKA